MQTNTFQHSVWNIQSTVRIIQMLFLKILLTINIWSEYNWVLLTHEVLWNQHSFVTIIQLLKLYVLSFNSMVRMRWHLFWLIYNRHLVKKMKTLGKFQSTMTDSCISSIMFESKKVGLFQGSAQSIGSI